MGQYAARAGPGALLVNAEPANYARWLQAVVGQTRASRSADERIVFINAWNGGAKAVIAEPDARYGRAFLEATALALKNS